MIMNENDFDSVFEPPLTDELDLHTFHPSDAKSVVEEYIRACHEKKMTRIRIIHGKGKSVLKTIVQKALTNHALVSEFHDAAPGSGGWGATIVYLKEL